MKFIYFLLSLILLLYFNSFLFASEEDLFAEEAFFKVEEEMASVASKYAQKITETPAILSVLTREQMQDMGCRTLADALRYVPGIGISVDELGGYYKVAIRGVRQWPNVLFLVDGQRLNDFYTGLALYDLSIDNIEKVEIIRGPGSSIHGTGGFVGVISVITNQNMPEGITTKVTGGENKELRTSINWSGKIEGWKTNLFAEIFQTDGQKHQLYGSPVQVNLNSGRTQPHLPIEYIGTADDTQLVANENNKRGNLINFNQYSGSETALVNIGQTIEEKEQAFIDYKMAKQDMNIKLKYIYDKRGPNIGLRGWKMPNTSLERSIITSIIDKTNKINDNLDVIAKFYFDQQMVNNKYQVTADNPIVGEVTSANRGEYQILEYSARTYGAEFQANYVLKNNTIVSGIQYERLGLFNYNFHKENSIGYMEILSQENRSRTVMGIYIQDEFRPNQFIGITAGVRHINISDFGKTTNPKIGAVYMLGKHFNQDYLKGIGIKISYATAFRAPTFQELYDKTQADLVYGAIGYPNLKPETIKTYEGAIEYEYKWLRLKANYYENEIKDQIGVTPGLLGTVQGTSNPYFNNSSLVKTKGYELELKTTKHTLHKFFPDMWYWANVSKVSVDAEAFSIGITQMAAVKRLELPQWEFSFGINTGISEYLRASVSYERISERNSNTRTTIEREVKSRWRIPEFDEYNFHIYSTPKLFKNYTIGLKVFNAGDKETYDDPTTIGAQEVQRENKTMLGYIKYVF